MGKSIMPLSEISKIEAWIGAGIALLIGAIKGMRMLFKLQTVVEEHDTRLKDLELETHQRFDKVDEAINHVDDKSAERHRVIGGKIDNIYNILIKHTMNDNGRK